MYIHTASYTNVRTSRSLFSCTPLTHLCISSLTHSLTHPPTLSLLTHLPPLTHPPHSPSGGCSRRCRPVQAGPSSHLPHSLTHSSTHPLPTHPSPPTNSPTHPTHHLVAAVEGAGLYKQVPLLIYPTHSLTHPPTLSLLTHLPPLTHPPTLSLLTHLPPLTHPPHSPSGGCSRRCRPVQAGPSSHLPHSLTHSSTHPLPTHPSPPTNSPTHPLPTHPSPPTNSPTPLTIWWLQ